VAAPGSFLSAKAQLGHKVITRESSYCFQRVLAIAILSVRLSVCPSVRPSVRLSHGWISQKRCKRELRNLYRQACLHKSQGMHHLYPVYTVKLARCLLDRVNGVLIFGICVHARSAF